MAPVDLRTFRDGTAYVVDVVKDEVSSAAHDHARGKAIPQVNSNVEALPQLNVTAESMTVMPPARASAAAGPPAPPVERHAVTTEPVLAPPVAPAEQMQESTIAVQSNATAPIPKLKESQSSAEFTPMADKADRSGKAKAKAEAKAAAEGAAKAEAEARAAAEAKAAADARAAADAKAAADTQAAVDAIAATEAKIAAETRIAAEAKAAAEAQAKPAVKALSAGQTASAVPAMRPLASASNRAAVVEAPTSSEKPGQAAVAAPAPPPGAASGNHDAVPVELSGPGAGLKLSFHFAEPTAAAVFSRADTLWMVFDCKYPLDIAALIDEPSHTIRDAEFSRDGDAAIVRLRLDHPHLSSIAQDGPGWSVTIGDAVVDPTRALDITRNLVGQNRASVTVNFEHAHRLHSIRDPNVGDTLWVVTSGTGSRLYQRA